MPHWGESPWFSVRAPFGLGVGLSVCLLLSLLVPLVLVPDGAQGSVVNIFEQVGPPFVEGDRAYRDVTLGQSFVATAGYRIERIDLMVYDLRESDVATLTLRPDSAGRPADTVLATSTVDGPTGYIWLSFSLDNRIVLTAGSPYWIVLESGESKFDGYRWAKQVGGPYTDGTAAEYEGADWNQLPDRDYLFRTWGVEGASIEVGVTVDSAFGGPLDPLRYTIAFDNDGTLAASFVWINVSLSPYLTRQDDDALLQGGQATGTGRWTFFAVGIGSHAFHLNTTVNADVFDGLPLEVTATLDYADPDGVLQERTTATAWAIARVPSLLITKTASSSFVSPGDPLTFTITVDNAGSQNASYVWINDTLPTSVTYVNDTAHLLPVFVGRQISGQTLRINLTDVPQATFAFDINVQVALGLPNGTWITNHAFANYTDSAGRVRESLTASATARIHGSSIRAQKTAQAPVVQPADDLAYVLRFDNVGDEMARRVWINDSLPSGIAYVADTAAAQPGFLGQTISGRNVSYAFTNVSVGNHAFVVATTVESDLPEGSLLTNRARLDATNSDGASMAPSWSNATVRLVTPVLDLALSGPETANPGDRIDFSFVLMNTGSGTASDAWVNVTLPSPLSYASDTAGDAGGVRSGLSWRFRNVTSANLTFTLTAQTSSNVMDSDTFETVAGVEYLDRAGMPGPRFDRSASFRIVAPRFSLSVVSSRPDVSTGGDVVLTITYENFGNGTAADVWVNNSIPAGSSFVRSSVQYASTSGSEYTWHFLGVSTGRYTFSLTIRAEGWVEAGTGLTNRATLAYSDANGNFVEALEASTRLEVSSSGTDSSGSTMLAILILLVTVIAVLAGYIGWKVYGIGRRDRDRIEDIMLLHRSGMLIRHLTKSLRPDIDSDVLSGMIVAVQSFVRESFKFQEGALEELKYGSHRLLLAHGRFSILAAVVSAKETGRLWHVLTSNLKVLEDRIGPILQDWNGDLDQLSGADNILAAILEGRIQTGEDHEGRARHPEPAD